MNKPMRDIFCKRIMAFGLMDSSFWSQRLKNWQPTSHICPWICFVWQARFYIFKKLVPSFIKLGGFT